MGRGGERSVPDEGSVLGLTMTMIEGGLGRAYSASLAWVIKK